MKGVVLAGTGSGVGKTSITTGLMSRLSKSMTVQAFKAGPDFIDPMYHTAATGRRSRNLDSFLMDDGTIRNLVGYASRDADICVIEGVRGLYEGLRGDDDVGSTAYLAKLLGFPVIVIVDARSLTRSAAAIVNGFRSFDPGVNIAGVILNNVSGRQHSEKLRTAMERYCPDMQLVGMIPKNPDKALEQRYLGLKTLRSFAEREITPLQELTDPIDLDRVLDIAESSPSDLPTSSPYTERSCGLKAAVPVDDSYCFYYEENIECLRASGFEVTTFRPTDGDGLPDADLYYLGGGYPELHADQLSANMDFLEGIRDEGLMVRRINIRQVLPVRREFSTRVDQRTFKRFKEDVRNDVDRVMLERVAPYGTVLRNVYTELHDGNTTFGRQIGSYPLLVGIPYKVDLEEFHDVLVTGWGYRSVTGITYPFDINSMPMSALAALPGIGRKRASKLVMERPLEGFDDLLGVVEDPHVVDGLRDIVTFGGPDQE